MKKISEERLIELAENRVPPTAEEQRALAGDPALAAELNELRGLLVELRSQPAPLDERGHDVSVLRAVSDDIARLREARSLRRGLSHVALSPLSLAAALMLVFGLWFLAPGGAERAPDLTDSEDYALSAVEMAYPTVEIGSLQVEAGDYDELDLFNDISGALDEENGAEALFDESSFELMQRAAELNNEAYARLKESFDGASF